MILGMGLDMVDAGRFGRWLGRGDMVERFFGPREAAYALSRGSGSALALAARFAAKEAFGKALGTGLRGLSLRSMEVIHRENGAPVLDLGSEALGRLRASGGERVHLSLSHDGDLAVAAVIIEGDRTW